jgi:hypothetical protein
MVVGAKAKTFEELLEEELQKGKEGGGIQQNRAPEQSV